MRSKHKTQNKKSIVRTVVANKREKRSEHEKRKNKKQE